MKSVTPQSTCLGLRDLTRQHGVLHGWKGTEVPMNCVVCEALGGASPRAETFLAQVQEDDDWKSCSYGMTRP